MESLLHEEDTPITLQLASTGYDVEYSIGAGTGGQVYKATQRSTGQAVAVKVLSLGELEGDRYARRIERFRREIAFCSSLYHPDIVRLLDSGTLTEGNRFAVFEFIPGRTLAEVLRDEGMLTVQRATHLMAQALPPLAYAHAQGIAHRDFKPGNVMVTNDNGRDRLKILDFGISISVNLRDEAEFSRLTQSHEWLGTPLYAAPEQLRGDPTGPKADLYAWALTFVECLTGRSVVSGKSLLDIISQQSRPTRHELPSALTQHRLGALLQRVLEKDPSKRLGDAQLVHSLLERIPLDRLEDAQGYLRAVSPVTAPFRARQPGAIDTITDGEIVAHTEQRYVTSLCYRISLVGSGGLSSVQQIDALLDDSYNMIGEVLRQFGATPTQTVGGYSLWYFGLSQVNDADARLAMRCALEIVNRLETLPSWFGHAGLALATRVGIHAGPVTVLLTDGNREPVDGATARLALELTSLEEHSAAPTLSHRILVSEEFRQAVFRFAELDRYGDVELVLPWRAAPSRAFRLKGESLSTDLRSERAPFVGRNTELERLTDTWRKAAAGEGAAVLLEGEPGIGKTRLAAELMARLATEGCRTLEVRCLPEWHNAVLRPLHLLVAELLGITAGDDGERAARLQRKLTHFGFELSVSVPLFCAWLSVPVPPGYAPLAWSPQKQRQQLHALVVELLLRLMERGSVLLVEDIHWADPSTLELVDALLTASRQRSALTVMTTRPERLYSWANPPERIVLAGLEPLSAKELAAALLNDGAEKQDLESLVLRSDGIPLYLEELALSLGRAPASPAQSLRTSNAEPLPAGLRHLLSARLDVLGQCRQTAQFAAALGREFALPLLTELQAKDELSLVSDLEELVGAQVLLKRLHVDGPVYTFRHALIREAAYDSMNPTARRHNHELIASGLLDRFPKLAEAQPDVIAHHYDRAESHSNAIHYWHLAAQRASAASAHEEAMSHIDRALAIQQALAADARSPTQEAELLLTRAAIIVAKRGYTDPEAESCFERVTALVSEDGPGVALAFAARWGVWYFNNARCNLRESCEIADELNALAQKAGDPVFRISAWTALTQSRFCVGKLEESVRASRACSAEYDPEAHRLLTLRYGDDPRVSGGSFEVLAELLRGRYTVAIERADELWQLIEQLGYASLKAGMHGQMAWAFLHWGGSGAVEANYERARAHAQSAIKIAQEFGFPFWELFGKMSELAIRIESGEVEVARELKMYSDIWCSFGAFLGRDWHLAYVARGLHGAGQFVEALQLFDDALAFCADRNLLFFEPEIRRQRAALLADVKNPAYDLERALLECWRAADDAHSMGAKWWELSSLSSAVRFSPASAESAKQRLSKLLDAFPWTADEPPLLREARALAS